MRNSVLLSALLMAIATPLAAQGMGGQMGMAQRGPAPAPAARFMLAHTGELNLSDAQVVKLAAIERRAEARRVATRTAMDSMRSRMMAQGMPTDSAARAARHNAMMSTMQATRTRMQEQQQADLKESLAVLTTDQQAKAWQIVAQARGPQRQARPGQGARPGRAGGMNRPGRAGGMNRPGAGMPGMNHPNGMGQGQGLGPNHPDGRGQGMGTQRPPG